MKRTPLVLAILFLSSGLMAQSVLNIHGWSTRQLSPQSINETTLRTIADRLSTDGTAAAGYNYIFLADGWQGGRNAQNELIPDPVKFPSGIKALAQYVHSKGLKLGIYDAVGQSTGSGYTASLNFEEQDAQTFVTWGIDYLDYDFCDGKLSFDKKVESFTKFYWVFLKADHKIVLSRPDYPYYNDERRWIDRLAYADQFKLRCLTGLSLFVQYGTDPENKANKLLYFDKELLAISQDSLSSPGTKRITKDSIEVFARQLNNGDEIVAFVNRGNSSRQADFRLADLKLFESAVDYDVRDLDHHRDLGKRQDWKVSLEPNGVSLLRLRPYSIITGKLDNHRLKELTTVIISPEHPFPVAEKDFRAVIIQWSDTILKTKSYTNVKAHPSSAWFPGSVKPGYVFTTKTVHVVHKKISDTLTPIVSHLLYSQPWEPIWYSTGLYAVAGQYIELTLPKGLTVKDLKVQIGAHTDVLDNNADEPWRRMPRVVSIHDLTQKIKIASPFGGLIYITCPAQEESWEADIQIDHAVSAPLYIQGKTTPEEWKKQLADNKAPWGELASRDVIITLPDTVLHKISDPDHILQVWNRMLEGEMDLAQVPLPFYRAQRFVIDEHMSGGGLHSGYPIMVHHSPRMMMESVKAIIEPDGLMKPSQGGTNWGFFHEVGHDMQNIDWVFDGTGEVSNNLFSLYTFDRLVGGRDSAHVNIGSSYTMQLMKAYFARGAHYSEWKDDPWLGLITMRQLQEAFGWETFKDFFRRYHQLNSPDLIKDEEKLDFFVLTFSKAARQNIAPFFRKWGIPVSTAVDSELSPMPVFMPYNFPPAD